MTEQCPICDRPIDGNGYVCSTHGEPVTVMDGNVPRTPAERAEFAMTEAEAYGGDVRLLREDWNDRANNDFAHEYEEDAWQALPAEYIAIMTDNPGDVLVFCTVS